MSFTCLGFNENHIITFEFEEKKIINPFEVAIQAMVGKNVSLIYEDTQERNLVPRYFPLRHLTDNRDDFYAQSAAAWLLANAKVQGEVCFWEYEYPITYQGECISSPWKSAFGQSYGILAMVHWYRMTDEPVYLEYLQKGICGLLTPLSKGGVVYEREPEDLLWFEEIPNSQPTHILNAHLVSILALMEANEILKNEEYAAVIAKAIQGLEKNIKYYDCGSNSVYEISNTISKVIQLRYRDQQPLILVKRIRIYDGEEEIRDLRLNTVDAFNMDKDVYISGIDWGKCEQDGSRSLLNGYTLRTNNAVGGERQNTYLCFNNFKVKSDVLKVEIEYVATEDTVLQCYTYDFSGALVPLASEYFFSLPKNENCSSMYIERQVLNPFLSKMYHKYHIQLLEEINAKAKRNELARVIAVFRSYNKQAQLAEKPNRRNLNYLFVSVNEKCGLRCKMCDVGMRNESASIYKNLTLGGNDNLFNQELFLKRCEEAGKDLECIHFIGTEPTLYKDLPVLVEKLNRMEKTVRITTNGIILNEVLGGLLELDVKELWISIDGPEHIHDEIRGKEGLYRSIVETLIRYEEKIRQCNLQGTCFINISCAITPLNYSSLAQLAEEMCKLPVNCVSFTHMNYVTPEIALRHNAKSAYTIGPSCIDKEMNPALVNPISLFHQIHQIKKLNTKVRFVFAPNITNYLDIEDFYCRPDTNILSSNCSVMNNCLQLNSDGSACIMARCYSIDLGNINECSLKEIFYGYQMKSFIRELSRHGVWEPCYRCCGLM